MPLHGCGRRRRHSTGWPGPCRRPLVGCTTSLRWGGLRQSAEHYPRVLPDRIISSFTPMSGKEAVLFLPPSRGLPVCSLIGPGLPVTGWTSWKRDPAYPSMTSRRPSQATLSALRNTAYGGSREGLQYTAIESSDRDGDNPGAGEIHPYTHAARGPRRATSPPAVGEFSGAPRTGSWGSRNPGTRTSCHRLPMPYWVRTV